MRTTPTARKVTLHAAVLARCYVCQKDGPVAKLSEHLREDHALSGALLREVLALSTRATVAA